MFFLNDKASKERIREAEAARRNRQEVIKALTTGEVSRRDLFRWGVFTAGGGLLAKNGFSPFVKSAYGQVPTGAPASPLFGCIPFTQPMARFDVIPHKPISALTDGSIDHGNSRDGWGQPLLPTRTANLTPIPVRAGVGTGGARSRAARAVRRGRIRGGTRIIPKWR